MTSATLLTRLKDIFEVRLAYAQIIPSSVARLLLIVTGPDFPQIEANIDIATGRVTVNVPVGNDRTFEVRAFPGASSALNFIGRTTANVTPVGTSVTVNMQAASLQPPVANAGPDQRVLFVGQTVQLDGSGSSDADGDPLTFRWSFTSRPPGSQATLSNATVVNPTFVADVLGIYVVQLIVNDGTIDSLAATVTITSGNTRPVANAGPDQAVLFVGQTVQLDGSGSSDGDGDPLTFRWSFTSRPPSSQATLSNATVVNPTFVADVEGTYVVQLIVNDGTVDSLLADTVTITADNLRPVANAGPDQAVLFVGQTVQLDGSGSSDADGDPLTFRWSFTSRPPSSQATLSNATVVNPTFVADVLGIYVVQLIVNDGTVDSLLADIVTITAGNPRPVANAGPDQRVLFVGQTVQLDGSGSSDGDPLTFRWSFTSRPPGSQATLSNATVVNPTFVADVLGIYVVQLIVNDGTVDSLLADTVTITAGNPRPVANAGPDQRVLFVGQTVQLDGSGSSDGDPLTFRWSFTSRPPGSQATLSNATVVNPTFVADVERTYVVQLIVNDGTVDSLLADTVMVAADNLRPVANACPDQRVVPGSAFCEGQSVQLDGSGSSDADPDPLTYRWTFTTQPEDSQPILSDPNIVNPTFELPCVRGTYVVQLIVNDGTIDSLPDTVSITVEEEYYYGGSIDSKTRFASILGTASLTVMILGLFARRRHGSTRQRIER